MNISLLLFTAFLQIYSSKLTFNYHFSISHIHILIHLGIMSFMLFPLSLLMRSLSRELFLHASSSVRIATETKTPYVCESSFQSMIFPRWKCRNQEGEMQAKLVSRRRWKILAERKVVRKNEKHKQENRVLILFRFCSPSLVCGRVFWH